MSLEELDSYLHNQSPRAGLRLYERFKHLRFNIKDLNVSSRVFTHWRKFKLIPLMPSGTWVNIDVFQFVWVEIIRDLREFNLPLETIAKVRDELFETFKFESKDIFDDNGKVTEEARKQIVDLFGAELADNLENNLKDDPSALDQFFKIFRLPLFMPIVLNLFFRKADHILLIGANGRVEVTSEEEYVTGYHELHESLNNKPIIHLPMKRYLLQLISDAKLVSRVEQMNILNNVEMEVLRAMRQGTLSELRIIFDPKDQHADLVYTYKGVVPENEMSKVLDRFRHKKHVQLSMKTNDGKTVSFEYQDRKRVHKLNGN